MFAAKLFTPNHPLATMARLAARAITTTTTIKG